MEQVTVEEARKHLGELIMPGQPPRMITKNGIALAILRPPQVPESSTDVYEPLRESHYYEVAKGRFVLMDPCEIKIRRKGNRIFCTDAGGTEREVVTEGPLREAAMRIDFAWGPKAAGETTFAEALSS